MQLNNTTNGRVIIINNIYVDRNRIDYTIYEYGGSLLQVKRSHTFSTILLTDYLNQTINYTELCYNTLMTELSAGYEVNTDDTQNWTIPETSGAVATTLRIYVPSTVLSASYHSGDDLDTLLQAMNNIPDQIQKLYNGLHVYVISLSAANRTILESYAGIVIEEKL